MNESLVWSGSASRPMANNVFTAPKEQNMGLEERPILIGV
jgi:hypothetical protein